MSTNGNAFARNMATPKQRPTLMILTHSNLRVYVSPAADSNGDPGALTTCKKGLFLSVLGRTSLLSIYRGEFMKSILTRLWTEEEGQDLTEYALLLVLLTLAAVTTLGTLATAINGVFKNAQTALQNTAT
jgi:Flp pilus assembly pilin Flp